MTYSFHSFFDCTGGDRRNGSLYSLEGEAELERFDREAGHDYLPMDVYVDPRTVEQHFQGSSIRTRRKQILQGANRAH